MLFDLLWHLKQTFMLRCLIFSSLEADMDATLLGLLLHLKQNWMLRCLIFSGVETDFHAALLDLLLRLKQNWMLRCLFDLLLHLERNLMLRSSRTKSDERRKKECLTRTVCGPVSSRRFYNGENVVN